MAKTKNFVLLLSLQIIVQVSELECKPEPGQKAALGAGLLAGGLAGAAVTTILTQNSPTEHHYHHPAHNDSTIFSPVPNQVPATTIERSETFSNGCYKQVIKEADVTDIRRFIETEQLICPPGISPASVTVLSNQLQEASVQPLQMMPLMPMVSGHAIASSLQPNTTQYFAVPPNSPDIRPPNITVDNDTPIAVFLPPSIPATALPPILTSQKNEPSLMESPLNATATVPFMSFMPALTYKPEATSLQPNSSLYPHVLPPNAPEIQPPHLIPVDSAPIAVLPPLAIPAAPLPAVLTQQKNEPSVEHSPVLKEIPNSATSQVVIISKKVGYYGHDDKKTNTASSLYNINCLVVFVAVTIFSHFI